VWLVVADGPNEGKVILQQRAETEIEDGAEKPQSNPNICQPTWNEKLEPGESLIEAVLRGAEEELGEKFRKDFHAEDVTLFNVLPYTYKGEPAIGYNYVGHISSSQLAKVKLHKGARPKFKVVSSKTHVLSLNKGEGIDLEYAQRIKDATNTVVLFSDQCKAFLSLFSLKEKLTILQ